MDCLHSRLHRLVSDSHLGKEMNKLLALIDRWIMEAILLALRAACGAAAAPTVSRAVQRPFLML